MRKEFIKVAVFLSVAGVYWYFRGWDVAGGLIIGLFSGAQYQHLFMEE